MSVIDVTAQLKVHQQRMAAIEVYIACGKEEALQGDFLRRFNVRVTLSDMPTVGSDHADGKMYTYRFVIPSLTKNKSSEGSLGRFHDDHAAFAALTQRLDLQAVQDLRSLGMAFETYGLADTTLVNYGKGGRHFSVSHGIPRRRGRWHWLQVNSLVVDKEAVVGIELNQGDDYYPTTTPDEYVAVYVDACVPKSGVMTEMGDLLGYVRL